MRPAPVPDAAVTQRVRIELRGMLQGLGLRPYVSGLARASGLGGWVRNSASGVTLEAEGPRAAVAGFEQRLAAELPPHARIDALERTDTALLGETAFEIRDSVAGTAGAIATITPDIASCAACVAEIFDPRARRYEYPFTSCAQCGPRFSILEALPFDRSNTTLRAFALCAACQAEYDDPDDRRYHAQTIACADCGPRVWFEDHGGERSHDRRAAIPAAAAALRHGQVIALKGLGGFQLLADARNEEAVSRLRERKRRPAKPFAILAPDLAWVRRHCVLSPPERDLLCSGAAPIVLLARHPHRAGEPPAVAAAVAPRNPLLGVMLPTTPLHHLLAAAFGGPLVATSGNVAGEPLVADNAAAREGLRGIADGWLLHDRDIAWPLDDSVARLVAGRPLLLRMARGYAPRSLALAAPAAPALALGGQLKASLAVTMRDRIVLGPYIGDLHTPRARRRWQRELDGMCGLHGITPATVACDEHPDYYTSAAARACSNNVVRVQHHLAHVLACVADNALGGPVLGVAFDGSGYGSDGTVWGGEFLRVEGVAWQRIAHLRPFALPGGERAVSEPRRAAAGLLFELFGATVFDDDRCAPLAAMSDAERRIIRRMLVQGINSPRSSSVGRLFDAVAALLDLVQVSRYEGEAAMALEFALGEATAVDAYPLPLREHGATAELDWAPLVHALLADSRRGAGLGHIAAAFHNALAAATVAAARRAGVHQVVLSGGCFQNRYLSERTIVALRAAGFAVYWHRHVPPNDGALALGQAAWAARLRAPGAV